MKCSKCGTELESNALICPFCGQVVSYEDHVKEQYGDKKLTKAEFLNLETMKSCKSNIISCGIALYILGVINMGLQIFWGGLPLDGIILILFGLGVHLGKSRICAILCTVYSVINMAYMAMETGRVTGWWILLVGIYAIIYTFKFNGAWSKYQKDGTLPVEKK